jgi:cytochrome c6
MTCLAFRVARQLLGAIALILVLVASTRADDSATLYKAKCAYCHGTDGKGDTPVAKKLGVRDFASPKVQKETDKELIDITTKGKNKMPGYQSSLTKSQITDLIAYVHGLVKK